MSELVEQTLQVKLGASGISFDAKVRLDTGAGSATWHGSDESGSSHWYRHIRREVELGPLDEAQLDVLREFAHRMHSEGDYQYRQQFAQAGIMFVLDGDPPITWDYHLDGGVPLEANDAYDVVSDQVFAALRRQRAAEKARGPLLPAVTNDEELMKLYRETEPWLAAAQDVAKKQQLSGDTWARASDGSQIVMLGEDAIIKFYVPFWESLRCAMLEGYGAGEELLDRIFESFLLHEFGRLGVLDLDGLESIADVRQRFIDL